jgi:hypothetical protein
MISGISGMGGGMAHLQRMGPPPDPQEKFNEMDANADGSLGVDELGDMAGKISEMTGKEVSAEDLIDKLDTDGNGSLEMSELPEPPGFGEGGFSGPPPFLAADGSIKPMEQQGAQTMSASSLLDSYLFGDEEEESTLSMMI